MPCLVYVFSFDEQYDGLSVCIIALIGWVSVYSEGVMHVQ